jgi:predicted Zn-dependent protease
MKTTIDSDGDLEIEFNCEYCEISGYNSEYIFYDALQALAEESRINKGEKSIWQKRFEWLSEFISSKDTMDIELSYHLQLGDIETEPEFTNALIAEIDKRLA